LQRNEQDIATERGDEPRQSRGGYKDRVVRFSDRQTERRHVLQGLAKETVELFVAGLDLGHRLQLFRHRLGVANIVARPDTIVRRVVELLPRREPAVNHSRKRFLEVGDVATFQNARYR
jgi:hypothetical protein